MIVTGSKVFGGNGAEYVVLEFVGSGTFGTVYKVREQTSGRILALKTLAKPSEQTDLASFINEGKQALTISHPNVLSYYFFHDGTIYLDLPPYILMEFAAGGSLEDLLKTAQSENKAFSVSELREMFKQLVAGMAAVNSKLIHRDIKPANILLNGTVLKIADFGLAKLVAEATRTFTFKGWGSYPYIAPEGWRHDKNTIQLDIYAMGIVFYQLAALRLPFDLQTADPQKWMEAHLYKAVASPDKFNANLGPKLSQVIMKMIEKDSTKRFSEWTAIQQLLDAEEPASEEQRKHVSGMLELRLKEDTAAQEAAAKAEREARKRDEFCKVVKFQAEQAIIQPIQELLDDFNRQYSGPSARMTVTSFTLTDTECEVVLPSGKRIDMRFSALLREMFKRQIHHQDHGRQFTRTEVRVPEANNRTVQAWGVIGGTDGRGFNFLLLERPGEIYGEWFLLINTEGLFVGQRRPNPFPIPLNELEEQMHYIGVLSTTQMTLKPFDINYVKTFVSQYV